MRTHWMIQLAPSVPVLQSMLHLDPTDLPLLLGPSVTHIQTHTWSCQPSLPPVNPLHLTVTSPRHPLWYLLLWNNPWTWTCSLYGGCLTVFGAALYQNMRACGANFLYLYCIIVTSSRDLLPRAKSNKLGLSSTQCTAEGGADPQVPLRIAGLIPSLHPAPSSC